MFFLYVLVLFLSCRAFSYALEFTTVPLLQQSGENEELSIRFTKHNLGEHNGKLLNPNVEGEYNLALCMWCHVQNIDVSFVSVEYRWSPEKTVRKFFVYSQTRDGQAVKSISPSSMVCLSCHDGANAPDVSFGKTADGTYAHGHPVFVLYKQDSSYLKPYNSPLTEWEGKKYFVYDLIKEYNGTIQCASCHDPHIPSKAFLRAQNERSSLCMGCHDI